LDLGLKEFKVRRFSRRNLGEERLGIGLGFLGRGCYTL
jgi:hypothetical protein